MNQASKEFIRVYRASNSAEGHLIKGMLEQHGMPVRLFGDGLSSGVGDLPADVMQVEIQVQPGYRELARQLIHEYEKRATEEAKSVAAWLCPDCGEENPSSFDICWKCRRPGGGLR